MPRDEATCRRSSSSIRSRATCIRTRRTPTARKINTRNPADVSIERVVENALETGTFLEINSQPNRLDLRDSHARMAGAAGVKIAVNTDAHQLSALQHIEMGVAQARRAWLTKDQVLNTRTWPQIEKLLK